MAKRGRSPVGGSFERLAFFKARPVNRDTQRVIGYKPGAGKAKTKDVRSADGVDAARPKRAGNVSSAQSRWSRPIERPVHSSSAKQIAKDAKVLQIIAAGTQSGRVEPAGPLQSKQHQHLSVEAKAAQSSTLEYSPCPRCGGRKSPYYACFDCGFSSLAEQPVRRSSTCPRCGARATAQHIKRGSCKSVVSAMQSLKKKLPEATKLQKKKLPEWERLPSDDVFDRGRVVSGGGFGVGKGKKR